MKKEGRKILLFFLCGIIFFSAWFCFAGELEIKDYPMSRGGFQPTNTDTPLLEFLNYIFDIGMFLGFMAAVYSLGSAGVFYLMSPAKPEYLASAKDRAWGAISGVLILTMTYLIVTTLNPQLSILRLGKPEDIPTFVDKKLPGIYFYKTNNCSGKSQNYTSNVENFGDDLNNQINSVLLVNRPGSSFISTMYSSPGLFGKCQDVDPNNYSCQTVANFANSASIHTYDFSPNGDGVYFYRKPFYEKNGGWLKIDNSQIASGGFFGSELNDLTFKDVPLEDKICTKWDDKGVCTNKKDPTLAGKEISSFEIIGDYIVYFVYLDPSDTNSWSYCQEFPTINDTNKEGPKQFKWEKTLNQKSLPNWIYIYPVKQK